MQGIAFRHSESCGTIIAKALRDEIRLNAFRFPELRHFLPAAMEFVDKLSRFLATSGGDSDWFVMPEKKINPIAYAEMAMADSPAYAYLGPLLRQNMRWKESQIMEVEGERPGYVSERLGSFVAWPIKIARMVPPSEVPDSWETFEPNNFQRMIETILSSVSQQRGHKSSTTRTIRSNLESAFQGKHLSRKFTRKTHISRVTRYYIFDRYAAAEALLPEIEELDEQDTQDERMMRIADEYTRKDSRSPGSEKGKIRGIHPMKSNLLGTMVVNNNPSIYSPKVLPKVTLAIMRLGLERPQPPVYRHVPTRGFYGRWSFQA